MFDDEKACRISCWWKIQEIRKGVNKTQKN